VIFGNRYIILFYTLYAWHQNTSRRGRDCIRNTSLYTVTNANIFVAHRDIAVSKILNSDEFADYEVDFIDYFNQLANLGAQFNPNAYLVPIEIDTPRF
jgi:hypothetical protein